MTAAAGPRPLADRGAAHRCLIVPAAGRGSRLGVAAPKALHVVAGRPLLDHVYSLHRAWVSQVFVVAAPAFAADVARCCDAWETPATVLVQIEPTGMLDAALIPAPSIAASEATEIWITWCDQIGLHPETIRRLADEASRPHTALALPTAFQRPPYIHLVRDTRGRIVDVLHRRDGVVMPDVGESDAGLFALNRAAYLDHLETFARQPEPHGDSRERNFLPFIPWLQQRGEVRTFPCVDWRESLGVNTPEDVRSVETYLSERTPA